MCFEFCNLCILDNLLFYFIFFGVSRNVNFRAQLR